MAGDGDEAITQGDLARGWSGVGPSEPVPAAAVAGPPSWWLVSDPKYPAIAGVLHFLEEGEPVWPNRWVPSWPRDVHEPLPSTERIGPFNTLASYPNRDEVVACRTCAFSAQLSGLTRGARVRFVSAWSLKFVGGSKRPQCEMEELDTNAGKQRAPDCHGRADHFVWAHSGQGQGEMAICDGMLKLMMEWGMNSSPRLDDEHGIALDEHGIWRLLPGSELT